MVGENLNFSVTPMLRETVPNNTLTNIHGRRILTAVPNYVYTLEVVKM
jgi:hypothetical protein